MSEKTNAEIQNRIDGLLFDLQTNFPGIEIDYESIEKLINQIIEKKIDRVAELYFKDFTPADLCQALDKIHQMRQNSS